MAAKISLNHLLALKDRADKFISNVFRHRIDLLLRQVDFYQCKACQRIMTKEQASMISCTGYVDKNKQENAQEEEKKEETKTDMSKPDQSKIDKSKNE